MTATVSLRAYTGAGAATESAALDGVTLISEDALTGADVDPGTRSFERWLRLRLDTAPVTGVATLWLSNTGGLPEGVSLLFGVTDVAATPVATPSLVATKTLTSGQKFVFDMGPYSEAGEHSRYVVIQEVAAADAAPGAIPAQALVFGWSER